MAKALATKDPLSQRMRSIKRVLWIILLLNLAVAAAKYLYGSISGSASMQADGIHSVFDSAGNVVGLVGIALAARPADDSHPTCEVRDVRSLRWRAAALAAFEVSERGG
ncbi:MAG: cation transporter [Eggerthellaceae bacterium]